MIQIQKFGEIDGREITKAILQSAEAEVSILNFGCVIQDWRVNTKNGAVPVVLGYENIDDYLKHSQSAGIIAGRVANRTAKGQFTLNGRKYQLAQNEGEHHLHGGMSGLGGSIWKLETEDETNSVKLTYHSEDGEEGYPATVDFTVTFRLQGTQLICEMFGTPDAETPINLAQHNYYSLGGAGDIRDDVIQVSANEYMPVDAELIPTGEVLPVKGTLLDFSAPATLNENDPERNGVDHNLVLASERDRSKPAATVYSPKSNLELKLWTDEPGIQIYDSLKLNVPVTGLDGAQYAPFSGLCLEPQHYPDSMNHPEWPSIVSSPEKPYYQKLIMDISER